MRLSTKKVHQLSVFGSIHYHLSYSLNTYIHSKESSSEETKGGPGQEGNSS